MLNLPVLLRAIADLLDPDARPPQKSRASAAPRDPHPSPPTDQPSWHDDSDDDEDDDIAQFTLDARLQRFFRDVLKGAPKSKHFAAHDDECGPPPHDPEWECGRYHDDAEFDDFDGEPYSETEDWRRWYSSHKHGGAGEVPESVVRACLDDMREASVLHSVALLEIARKWGFSRRL